MVPSCRVSYFILKKKQITSYRNKNQSVWWQLIASEMVNTMHNIGKNALTLFETYT